MDLDGPSGQDDIVGRQLLSIMFKASQTSLRRSSP